MDNLVAYYKPIDIEKLDVHVWSDRAQYGKLFRIYWIWCGYKGKGKVAVKNSDRFYSINDTYSISTDSFLSGNKWHELSRFLSVD